MASPSTALQRRLNRERKEFIHKRSVEVREAKRSDRKRLRSFLDEEYGDADRTTMDDEYASAGRGDPQVLITTSNHPSQKLVSFVKELRLLFPNASRFNRGSTPIKEVVALGRQHRFTDLIMVHETRGEPDTMIIQHLPHGPTFYYTLFNVIMRHDIPDVGPMSEQYPHLIFENFSTKLGQRAMDGLRYLFPPLTKSEATRVVTFDNQNDFIAFRHHTFTTDKSGKKVDLKEIGPRFEMRLYMIKQGTVDMPDAETEWQLRSFTNTAKKSKTL